MVITIINLEAETETTRVVSSRAEASKLFLEWLEDAYGGPVGPEEVKEVSGEKGLYLMHREIPVVAVVH